MKTKHITLSKQADLWLENGKTRKRRPFRPATAENYSGQVEKHIKPLIGSKTLDTVDNKILKTVISELTAKGLSAGSITLIVNIIKQIVASATDENGNQLYPRTWNSDFIDMPVIKDQKRPIPSAQAVQDAIKQAEGYQKALIAIIAGTGLRINEALAIHGGPDDGKSTWWDAANGKIVVRMQRQGSGFGPVKTEAGEREVDLASALNAFLNVYLLADATCLWTNPIFPGSETFYRNVLVKCGILGGFHGLRRFRVTHLRLVGIPDALIHFWVGHEDESVTDAYTVVGPEIVKRKTFAEQAGLGFELEAL